MLIIQLAAEMNGGCLEVRASNDNQRLCVGSTFIERELTLILEDSNSLGPKRVAAR